MVAQVTSRWRFGRSVVTFALVRSGYGWLFHTGATIDITAHHDGDLITFNQCHRTERARD